MSYSETEETTLPKSTFFNLPKEKQQVLMQAIKEEFSRVPLGEALVSNIVTAANISRGSFYQYFEDKEDAFFYLLEQYAEGAREHFYQSLNEVNGDLFQAYGFLFKYLFDLATDDEHSEFFRNAFLNMNYEIEKTLTNQLHEDAFQEDLSKIKRFVKLDQLNVTNHSGLIHVLQILTAVTFQSLIFSLVQDIPADEAIQDHDAKLELLKQGLHKNST